MSVIELKDVTKTYSMGRGSVKVHALRGVSLTVNEGEFVSIMGHSGSGKSTLLNILGCLDRPTSGTYLLEGRPVEGLNSNQLAQVRNRTIGFVFQSFNLLPKLSAVNNVELPLIYAGVHPRKRREAAMAALETVGLADRAKHRPSELSGGQQQRVAIARALVGKPRLVLADEPTGNLDSASSYEIMEVLTAMNRQGITVVIVTHEPDIARYTPRVLTFRDGLCVEDRITPPESGAAASTVAAPAAASVLDVGGVA
ncbi:MAG: Macrolide export ATP-binding/permease protein MacB [Firmicutes bacterium ADurb.Bin506]|jgi:putative ABC transport system ATP-binding protein|nr:MAG: Macrolide export ATP-binding/permease protein MacB [Firmicutes bacterium ADurb.Bin506]